MQLGAFGACKELIVFCGESPIQGHLLYHILCTPAMGSTEALEKETVELASQCF